MMSVPAKPVVERNKKWQMELLMERLRNKATQQRSFPELSKSTRMALLEKRYALDAVEKEHLRKCLDSMQHCIKVTTKQGLVERLQSLSRQLGLKYSEENASLYISSEMFFVEILLDATSGVNDVKVHHECQGLSSCSELLECLVKGDFADFTAQLEGFASIYQLNAEGKIKNKAYLALQALEQDIFSMFQLNATTMPDVRAMIMQSPTGLVQKRRGGHSMKLTYFLSPMELLDLDTKSLHAITAELVHTKRIGQSVAINLEASVAHKLQVQPILNLNDPQNVTYDAMTTFNSIMLPASFVLTLNKPMPICQSLIKRMIRVTDLPFGAASSAAQPAAAAAATVVGQSASGDAQKPSPIMTLIATSVSNGLVTSLQKGLAVTLPDQSHCYFMTDNPEMAGEMIGSIPFTEPGHVFELVQLLRQQAMLNSLIGSCVRSNGKLDFLDSMTIFEVTALTTQQINVAMEHPFDDSMITVEFDLSHVATLQCKIFPSSPVNEQLSMKLSQVAQACLSIPVTMRALIKTFEQANRQQMNQSRAGGGGFGLSDGAGGGTAGTNGGSTGMDTMSGDSSKTPQNSNNNGSLIEGGGGGGESNNLMTTNAANSALFDNAYNVFDSTGQSQTHSPQGQQQMMNSGAGLGIAVTTEDDADGMAIKKRRVTGEDFWRSPKRTNNKLATDNSNSAGQSGASEDSNSLGGNNNNSDGTMGMESNNNNKTSAAIDFDLASTSQENESENTQRLVNGMKDVEDDDEEEEEADAGMDEYDGGRDTDKPVEDEDDDLGNILNEIKNNKDLNELFNNATEEDLLDSDARGGGGAASVNEAPAKKLSIEAQLARMGTPYVSITPIPAINSSTTSSRTTTMTTTSTANPSQRQTHHQLETDSSITTETSATPPPSSTTTTTSPTTVSSSTIITTTTSTATMSQRISTTTGSSSTTSSSSTSSDQIKSVLSDMGITTDKRLAIEIIPLSPSVVAAVQNQQQQQSLAKSTASVTITPIDVEVTKGGASSGGGQGSGSSGSRSLKKSSSSSSLSFAEEQERARIKKRRMEEYSEKVRKSQSTGGTGSGSRPASVSPKYATSPKPNSIFNSSSGRGSPKQSGSPKGDSRSPYSSSSQSPSSSSSGKPSMSTLKSASIIGSPKGEKSQKSSSSGGSERSSSSGGGGSSSSSSRDREREREKRLAGSPKIKPASVKLKPIDLNAGSHDELSQDGLRGLSGSLFKSGSAGGSSAAAAASKAKNSLSAVIDKLKSAQGPDGDMGSVAEKSSRDGRVSSNATGSTSGGGGGGKIEKGGGGGDGQSGSYIIKPSSDGMKLTINKTKSRPDGTKSSSSSSSSSLPRSQSSSSLKISSGKKYGSTNSYSSSSSSSSGKSKLPFQKSSSSGNLSSSSSSSSPSSGYKSSSSVKSVTPGESSKSGSSEKKPSKLSLSDGLTKPTTPQDVLKLLGLPSSNSMDGFMKSLDKKFQIPKLSARSSSQEGTKRSGFSSSSAPTTPTGLAPASVTSGGASDPKMLTDFLTKEVPLKYPFPLNLNTNFSAVGNNRSSPKTSLNSDEVTIAKVNSNSNSNSGDASPLERFNATTMTSGDGMRPPCAPGSDAAVMMDAVPTVDGKVKSGVATSFHPPSSPSVSLHIVKSPVPSPKTIVPSPHASSPCIDDELMDEALVGISGK